MNYKHGKYGSKVYSVWAGMLARCTNPNATAYQDYGGRGITVCAAWRDFPQFYADMGDIPAGGFLERKNNDLGYCPDNCEWVTRQAQNRNKRDNHLLTIGDETMPIAAWAERSGLKYGTVHQRIRKGWSAEAAVFTPLVVNRKGIPRGQRVHMFGAQHGVVFADERREAAA